jgi:hypothetical protein
VEIENTGAIYREMFEMKLPSKSGTTGRQGMPDFVNNLGSEGGLKEKNPSIFIVCGRA